MTTLPKNEYEDFGYAPSAQSTRNIRNAIVVRLLVALAANPYIESASAYLGGPGGSVEDDRVHMHAQGAARVTPSSSGSYTVQETILPTGTVVKQYVSTADVVFAVSWAGPFKPDLQQLLGQHFTTMVTRQSALVHAGHPFVRQHAPDLVVESGGHPRSFVGRAYLPSALPAGVAEQEIQ